MQVIYIGRETCSWCAAFLPNLWDAQEKFGYKTLYIDIAKIIDFSNGSILNQGDYDILASLTGEEYEGYMDENLGATPMVLIMKDNKIVGAQTGYSEYETFETAVLVHDDITDKGETRRGKKTIHERVKDKYSKVMTITPKFPSE